MGRYGRECCAVFFIFNYLIITFTNAEMHNMNDQFTNVAPSRDLQWYLRRKPEVWYEIFTGRKKRNIPYEENYRSPTLEREQLDALLERVQEPPWTLLAMNEGKRHTVNFTPRLGRDSEDDNDSDNMVHDTEVNKQLLSQISPPFAPRLGRRMNNYYFDPRLGKRNNQQKQLL